MYVHTYIIELQQKKSSNFSAENLLLQQSC